MAGKGKTALTLGVIVGRSGHRQHRVENIIRVLGLEPVMWAGNSRIFSEAQYQQIVDRLNELDATRPASPLDAVAAANL